jgi:hypothetical protein
MMLLKPEKEARGRSRGAVLHWIKCRLRSPFLCTRSERQRTLAVCLFEIFSDIPPVGGRDG